MKRKSEIIKELKTIPGIGEKLADILEGLGIKSVSDMKNRNPEKLYEKLCKQKKRNIDRCVLYTFRCAEYYSSNTKHNPELLKWWNWKEK